MRVRNRKALPEVTPKQLVDFATLFLVWSAIGDDVEVQPVSCVQVQKMARRCNVERTNQWLEKEGWIARAGTEGWLVTYKAGINMRGLPHYYGA